MLIFYGLGDAWTQKQLVKSYGIQSNAGELAGNHDIPCVLMPDRKRAKRNSTFKVGSS